MALAPARSQHTHPNQHTHHPQSMTRSRLRLALGLTLLVLVVEFTGGLLSGSLALLSDAGHVLTDVVALGLAWFATVQAERPPNDRKTFGYHRTEILAALVNAALLILIVAGIAFEAVQRLRNPVAVTPWLMFASALVGIAVNLIIAGRLHGVEHRNLNVRAALLHVLGDVGASVGVIVAGVVILLTGWYPIDALLSLAIALLIARGAWRVLRETVDVLMEATPRTLNITALRADLCRQPEVADVHDLHVWSITGGVYALSAHIHVKDQPRLSECDALVERLTRLLREDHQIAHATLQLECAGCVSPEDSCTLNGDGAAHGEPHTHTHTAGEPHRHA